MDIIMMITLLSQIRNDMYGSFDTTHKNILKSGKKLFLEKGFERTNLRELCKDAGVTTGAFYRHFKDKEALFIELVDPAIKGLEKMFNTSEEDYFNCVIESKVQTLQEVSSITTEAFIEYLYANKVAFKLLLHASDGTRYTNFMDMMVEWELRETFKMYEIMDENGIKYNKLTEKELHMLYHAYFSCLFESIFHDYEKKEALQYSKTLSDFFMAGWRKVHCL